MGTATAMDAVVAAVIEMVAMKETDTAIVRTTEMAMVSGTSTDFMWYLTSATWWEDDSIDTTCDDNAEFYYIQLHGNYEGDYYGNGLVFASAASAVGNGTYVYRRKICK